MVASIFVTELHDIARLQNSWFTAYHKFSYFDQRKLRVALLVQSLRTCSSFSMSKLNREVRTIENLTDVTCKGVVGRRVDEKIHSSSYPDASAAMNFSAIRAMSMYQAWCAVTD